MADNKEAIIIRRRKKGHGHGHHGGAWKVAYADFVTAMMAFFLLLWLLNVTTDVQRKGIADYFAPASVSTSESGASGMLSGQSLDIKGAEMSPNAPPGVAAESTEPPPPGLQIEGDEDDADLGQQGKTAPSSHDSPANDQKIGPTPGRDTNLSQAQRARIADAEEKRREAEDEKKFENLAEQLRDNIKKQAPDLAGLVDSLIIDQTEEGLRIQIVDQASYSMFPSGSAQMYPQTKKLLQLVAQAVGSMPNKLAISGHTDASPFSGSGDRDNWDLSAERANASRRVMVEAGIKPDRVRTVVGRADTEPLFKDNPLDPKNRRISIVLLRQNLTDAPSQSDGTPKPGASARPVPSTAGAHVVPAAETVPATPAPRIPPMRMQRP